MTNRLKRRIEKLEQDNPQEWEILEIGDDPEKWIRLPTGETKRMMEDSEGRSRPIPGTPPKPHGAIKKVSKPNFKVWDRRLSEAEILALALAPLPTRPALR